MTPSRRAAETANKRAERLRRKEAGEQRVECWVSAASAEWLKAESVKSRESVSDVVRECVDFVRRTGQ